MEPGASIRCCNSSSPPVNLVWLADFSRRRPPGRLHRITLPLTPEAMAATAARGQPRVRLPATAETAGPADSHYQMLPKRFSFPAPRLTLPIPPAAPVEPAAAALNNF